MRSTVSVYPILLVVLGGTAEPGCMRAEPPDEVSRSGQDLATSCTDTGIAIQLRAFIPQTLCGVNDSPVGTSCPSGYPEPLSITTGFCAATFHGDERGFSGAWDASHRLRGVLSIPTLRGDACNAGAVATATDCDASHRCACNPVVNAECTNGGCISQTQTAAAQVSASSASCAGTALDASYQVHAAYPFAIDINNGSDVFDKLAVHSSGAGGARAPLVGSSQQYTIDIWHTPFPFHEMVVQYACGTKLASVYQYAATDCGPGLNNVGDAHKLDIHAQRSFAIVYNPTVGVTFQAFGTGAPGDLCAGAADGAYCGNSHDSGFPGTGDLNTIYFCHGHATTQLQACSQRCYIQTPGHPDTCDPCAFASDGVYCGTSTLDGFPGNDGAVNTRTLYTCHGHVTTTTHFCSTGCFIAPPGVPDGCNANSCPNTCGTNCCPAGAWCGTSNQCCTGCTLGCLC